MSNYLEGEIYDAVLKNSGYTGPSTLYLAAHTANPTETGSVGEISGNGYARQTVAFGAHSGGSGTNSGTVTFTASGGDWGTITHVSIWDAVSGGNCLLYSAMDASQAVSDGQSLIFAAGTLTVTFD